MTALFYNVEGYALLISQSPCTIHKNINVRVQIPQRIHTTVAELKHHVHRAKQLLQRK